MAIPHTIQKQLIKKRLSGKTGKARLKEIEQIRKELPGFNTGHYGEIKKWLQEQIEHTKTASGIQHNDCFEIKRQGQKQFCLVGKPSVGKSSLIKALCQLQTKAAEYAFTTLKPIAGTVQINGAHIQLVDLPGLIQGAVDDIGGGKRLLGIIKQTDGIILVHDVSKPLDDIEQIVVELKKANVNKPLIIVGNKMDVIPNSLKELQRRFSGETVIGISTVSNYNVEKFKQCIWQKSNLIRVYAKNTEKPVILEKNATVREFAKSIHLDLVNKVHSAKVTGKSVKFANQQVGIQHALADQDQVELLTK